MAGAPALVAVAHGSRDPRSAATIRALVDRVAALRPDLDVRAAFLDLSRPRLPDVLDAVARTGHRDAVVVPLLLGRAFHARVDLPALVAAAADRHPGLALSIAGVLGDDPRLADAAVHRLTEAIAPGLAVTPGPALVTAPGPGGVVDLGVMPSDPGLGVVLAATGSRQHTANATVHRLATQLAARHGWHGCLAAFATPVSPSVPEAIELLRSSGARRIAVASWFLAPGLLPTRVAGAASSAGVPLAAPLGAHPLVADVVLARYAAATRHRAAA